MANIIDPNNGKKTVLKSSVAKPTPAVLGPKFPGQTRYIPKEYTAYQRESNPKAGSGSKTPQLGSGLTSASTGAGIGTGMSSTESLINALNQAKQAQAVASLQKARETQLSNLSGEEAGIKPMYYDKRNVTAATNMMGRRSLAEELASRGETNSGVADQANINANMSLQGETGLLNRQEAANISDIARRRTGVQNAYESDVASAKAGFEAQAMQNLIDQFNADRQFKLQEADTTGIYNGNQTMAAKQFEQAKSQQEIDNIFRQGQADIQNQFTNRQITSQEAQQKLDNLYRDKAFAEEKRQFNTGQSNFDKQFAQSTNQQRLDNLYRQQTFDYQVSRDTVGDSQWQQQMNLDLRKQTYAESEQKIQNALAEKRISQSDASQALEWAKFNAEKDPNSLDNQYKKAQIDAASNKTNTGTTATVDDYASTIKSLYTVNPNASNNYTSSIDKTGIKAYIDNLILSGVDEATINSLAAMYGIQ